MNDEMQALRQREINGPEVNAIVDAEVVRVLRQRAEYWRRGACETVTEESLAKCLSADYDRLADAFESE